MMRESEFASGTARFLTKRNQTVIVQFRIFLPALSVLMRPVLKSLPSPRKAVFSQEVNNDKFFDRFSR